MHPRLFCILKNAGSVEKDPRLEIIFNKFQLNLSFCSAAYLHEWIRPVSRFILSQPIWNGTTDNNL